MIVFSGFLRCAEQEMISGLPVRCRIEEALGHCRNGRHDSVYWLGRLKRDQVHCIELILGALE